MKVPILLILPCVYSIIGAADQIHSQVNLDLSKFFYSTKVIDNKSQLTITKLFKSPQHVSHEITLQNILAFARSQNIERVKIPRSIIDYPISKLCLLQLNITKIIIKDPNWNHRLVAYPAAINGVHELNSDTESDYMESINFNTDLVMCRIFAVNKDNVIIGGSKLAHDYHKKECAQLELLYVASLHRNNHIGSHLINACKEFSQAYGKSDLKLFAQPYGLSAMNIIELKNWYHTHHGFILDKGKNFLMTASAHADQSLTQSVTLEMNYSVKKAAQDAELSTID